MAFALLKASSIATIERQSWPAEEPLQAATKAMLPRAAVFKGTA